MNWNKQLMKTMSVILASTMMLSLAACKGIGTQQPVTGTEEKKDFVWVPEFIEIDGDSSFYNTKEKNGYMYYEKYDWDEETMTSIYSIESISLKDGSAGPSFPVKMEVDEESGTSRNVNSFVPIEDGMVTVEVIYNWNQETGEDSTEYYVCKYDQTGTKTLETDITEALTKDENNSWISNMTMDAEGRIYIAADTAVFLLDAEGNYHGTVSVGADTWIQGMGTGTDGKMYVSFYNRTGSGVILQEIDFAGKTLGQSYENNISGNGNGSLVTGLAGGFFIADSNFLYEYDMQSQTAGEVLNWLDCDINGSYINGVYALDDGRIAAISYDWNNNKSELAVLTKTPADQVQEKIVIEVAGLYTDSSVQAAAVNFNKSNDTYRVSYETYLDYNDVVYNGDESNYEEVMQDAMTRLNNDITSDNCPDILLLGSINVERFVAKGVFEDLNPWLEGSTVLKRDDYFENILTAYTYGDVLVAIPKSFELNTMVGKASDLGTEPGWTVEEMIAYGKEHPNAEILTGLTKDYAIELMLQYNQGSYVNWETGECNFNNESFISLLEFANQFPEEYVWDENEPSEPTKIGNGQLLLSSTYIYDFQSIQLPSALFNGDVCFIGFPNENGDSGTYLQASTGMAITTKSDCKEGAWAFYESFLTEENEMYDFGFSTRKSQFAEARAEATKVEYILDEKGEPVLDENGEPMIAGGGSSIGYGDDWMYTFHVTTEEEADLLEELIGMAKPATIADMTIVNIIKEEAGAYFTGQRSAADVAGIIQSRVQVYVNENR